MFPSHDNTEIIPLIDHPEGAYERKGIHTTSSIPTLSKALEGFERGELIAITAPPGNGKTMLARTLCMDMIKQKYKCLYLSYELTYSQLLRMFKLSGLEDYEEKASGNLDESYSSQTPEAFRKVLKRGWAVQLVIQKYFN